MIQTFAGHLGLFYGTQREFLKEEKSASLFVANYSRLQEYKWQKYQSYMPLLPCFCLSFKSKMNVNVKLSDRNSVSE